MSKRNLLLGTAAGKVGDLVFYRAGGEQRTRAKVTPNNPKTYAQQAQRSRMANVTLTYRALSALIKDTFPTRPIKQTAFNAFSADALPISPYLPKEFADKGEFVLAPVLVAKGSIPVPFYAVNASENGGSVEMAYAALENPTTEGALAAALIAWHPCCFAEGGALVLVVLGREGNPVPGNHTAKYVKINLDPTSTRTLASLDISVTTQQKQGDIDAKTTISYTTGDEQLAFAAVIEKPKTGGGYDVCDARLVLNDSSDTVYEEYISDQMAKEAAISYGGTQGACVINS